MKAISFLLIVVGLQLSCSDAFTNCKRKPLGWNSSATAIGPLLQRGFRVFINETELTPGVPRDIFAGKNYTVELIASANNTYFKEFLMRLGHMFRHSNVVADTSDALATHDSDTTLLDLCVTEEGVSGLTNTNNTRKRTVSGTINMKDVSDLLALDVTVVTGQRENVTEWYFDTYVLNSISPVPTSVPSTTPSSIPTISPMPTYTASPSSTPSISPMPTVSAAPTTTDKPTSIPFLIPDPGFGYPEPSLSPSSAPSHPPCISNLVELVALEFDNNTDLSQERIYYLCPNLVYRVDTQSAIWPRSNMTIMCGYEGRPEDNCIVSGGDIQILFAKDDNFISDVVIQGLSFVRSSVYNMVLSKPGSVRFIDCVFRDNYNAGIAWLRYERATGVPTASPAPSMTPQPSASPQPSLRPSASPSSIVPTISVSPTVSSATPSLFPTTVPALQNRRIKELAERQGLEELNIAYWDDSPDPSIGRSLASSSNVGEPIALDVSFEGCQFRNNSSTNPSGGLISMEGSPLLIRDSIFADNYNVDYLISHIGSIGRMDLFRNCFVDNNVDLAPVLNLGGGAFETLISSGTTGNDTLVCNYLAIVENGFTTCIDFDSASCSLTESPSAAPTTPTLAPTGSCYSTLNSITEEELSPGLNISFERTYVLCANTVYDVDRQTPFYPRSNSRYVCGDDGRVESQCLVTGGDFQVLSPFADDVSSNVVFEGISFVGARLYNVALVKPGDFTFLGCEFRDNSAGGSALLSYPLTSAAKTLLPAPTPGRRASALKTFWSMLPTIRNLQDNMLEVTFVASTFRNNTGDDARKGLIESEGSKLTVIDSLLAGNQNLDYVIGNVGGLHSMDLTGNCFVENVVEIASVVNKNGGILSSELNSGTEILDGRICQYIADIPTNGVPICQNFESRECFLTSTPTFAPTNSPTVSCIDSLVELNALEEDPLLNITSSRAYKLCSNTLFDVDAQTPIAVRPHIKVFCGDDGSSDNNCVISSGQIQLFSSFRDDYAPNVTFQGITFVGAKVHNVALVKPADILFLDCIFKSNINEGVVFTSFSTLTGSPTTSPTTTSQPSLTPTISISPSLAPSIQPSLMPTTTTLPSMGPTGSPTFTPSSVPSSLVQRAADQSIKSFPTPSVSDIVTARKRQNLKRYKDESNRYLQQGISLVTAEKLQIKFEDCIFQNNSATEPLQGIIKSEGNWISVVRTQFIDNYNSDFLISNIGGVMNVTETCFFDNSITVAPVLNLANGTYTSASNSGPFDEFLLCQFLADIETDGFASCTPYESLDGCTLFFTPSPTTTTPPSLSPSVSALPSISPSISMSPSSSPMPSSYPSLSHEPTNSIAPTMLPTRTASERPTNSFHPSALPSLSMVPSISNQPSQEPSLSDSPTVTAVPSGRTELPTPTIGTDPSTPKPTPRWSENPTPLPTLPPTAFDLGTSSPTPLSIPSALPQTSLPTLQPTIPTNPSTPPQTLAPSTPSPSPPVGPDPPTSASEDGDAQPPDNIFRKKTRNRNNIV